MKPKTNQSINRLMLLIGFISIGLITLARSDAQIAIETPSPYVPRLYIAVPGLRSNYEVMLSNAQQMLRYDPSTTVVIEQAELWKEKEISELVRDATERARQIGSDVIVLLDMDLEWGPEWKDATEWAGKSMNTISAAYSEIVSDGKRIVDAHSAGAVAFAKSLINALANKHGEKKLFDKVFLSNGRASVEEPSKLLQECGYSSNEVDLLLNMKDLPAFGSIAGVDAVKQKAGKSWNLYIRKDIPLTHIIEHGILVDNLEEEGTFVVYDGSAPYEVRTSVYDIKMSSIDGDKSKIKTGKRTELAKPRDRRKNKNDDYFKPPDFPPPPPPPPHGGAAVSTQPRLDVPPRETGKEDYSPPAPKGGVDINIKPNAKASNLRKLKDNVLKSKPSSDSVSYPIKFEEGDKP